MIDLVNMHLLLVSLIMVSAFSIAVILYSNSIDNVFARCLMGDLTGVWRGDDGGTYYVKQDANRVWWIGANKIEEGTGFSNVFKGQKNEDYITGKWVDVPLGKTRGNGEIEFQCDYFKGQHVLSKIFSSGGFGGWTLSKPGTAHLIINLQISGVPSEGEHKLCVGTFVFVPSLLPVPANDPSCVILTSSSVIKFDVVASGSVGYDLTNTERMIAGGKSCLGPIEPEQTRNCTISIKYE